VWLVLTPCIQGRCGLYVSMCKQVEHECLADDGRNRHIMRDDAPVVMHLVRSGCVLLASTYLCQRESTGGSSGRGPAPPTVPTRSPFPTLRRGSSGCPPAAPWTLPVRFSGSANGVERALTYAAWPVSSSDKSAPSRDAAFFVVVPIPLTLVVSTHVPVLMAHK
jgi:hypothetical protein